MNVVFYNNKSDKNYLTKDITQVYSIDCKIKESVDVLTPTLIVKGINLKTVNYCYIPDLKRYYFISDIVTMNSTILEIRLDVDVLMTYKAEILALSGIVSRQENLYNSYLKDTDYTALNYQRVQTKEFNYSFNSSNFVLAVAGKGVIA